MNLAIGYSASSTPTFNDENPARSVQRRRDGRAHHHHGARAQSAAWSGSRGAAAAAADVSRLRTQLHQSWDLLEQSSSHAAGDAADQRRRSLAESASALLAVADSVHDELDGRE